MVACCWGVAFIVTWSIAPPLLGQSPAVAPDSTATISDSSEHLTAEELQVVYNRAVARATKYLTTEGMRDDGSYHDQAEPGVTAIVVTALLKHGLHPDDASVAKSLAYLHGFIRPDGGIHGDGTFYRNYETSMALMCFVAANVNGRYDDVIRRARVFLTDGQWTEDDGVTLEDLEYGGAGYGRHKRPDLSNTQLMIDALIAAGDEADSEAIQRALIFVSRCQNLDTPHNPMEIARRNPDGGFYYTPASGGVSQAGVDEHTGGLRSYGSMTYAGLKSMIYAGLKPTDPRVQAATEWIAKNYDINTNPGMGDSGLYYYYHTFAKCLEAFGQPTITDVSGKSHDWRKDLILALTQRQQDNGSWLNANDRWMEGEANLVTGYALLALSHARAAKVGE